MGWFFGRDEDKIVKKKPEGWTEMHCHVLPGIDDGSPDTEASVSLVRGLQSLGCKHIIATPHIIGDMYRNNHETISAAAEKLRIALNREGIKMGLSFAAEYMMDDFFMNLLMKEEPLLCFKDKYLLTEFSYAVKPEHVEEISFEINTRGYQPILAHPERYNYFHHDFKQYHRLKDLGFSFQLNLLSLTGYYGKNIMKIANQLIKEGLIDFVGSDTHHQNHLNSLNESFNNSSINKILIEQNNLLVK
jgi:tyrosine-protein phosphatase YwqE